MDDLRLALFVGGSADILTLAEILDLDAQARAAAKVSADWACVSLLVDGVERWGPALSFGPLGNLVDQLPETAARLRRSERALICAGGSGGPISECLVFEPEGDAVAASVAAFDQRELEAGSFGATGGGDLDSFVDRHLPAMLEAGFRLRELPPVRVEKEALLRALEREAAFGPRAVALLGPGRG